MSFIFWNFFYFYFVPTFYTVFSHSFFFFIIVFSFTFRLFFYCCFIPLWFFKYEVDTLMCSEITQWTPHSGYAKKESSFISVSTFFMICLPWELYKRTLLLLLWNFRNPIILTSSSSHLHVFQLPFFSVHPQWQIFLFLPNLREKFLHNFFSIFPKLLFVLYTHKNSLIFFFSKNIDETSFLKKL